MPLCRLLPYFRHLFGKLNRWHAALPLLVSVGVAIAAADLERIVSLATQRYGPAAAEPVQAWRRLLGELGNQDEPTKIRRVNEFFNRKIQFADDIEVWGVSDYWATPLETLTRGEGDCEDFAVAKYATLKMLGVSIDKLRLTYVKARIGGPQSSITQAHMVLTYYPTAQDEPLVLDNLVADVRPASRRADLSPVFSFNAEGLWVGGTGSRQTHSTERLSRWRTLLARMRAEGIE